jgi:hypothetical protein
LTTDSHNEMVLMAGTLGVSSLVCLLNNSDYQPRLHFRPRRGRAVVRSG